MESPGQSTIREAEARVVPEELMRELHDANQHFHKLKQQVEQAMASTEDRHVERVELAAAQLREAEQRVEEINQKIHTALKPLPTR